MSSPSSFKQKFKNERKRWCLLLLKHQKKKLKEKKIIKKKKNAEKGGSLPFFSYSAFGIKHSSCLLLSTFL